MDDVDLLAGTGSLSYDHASADSRFVELQEELRSVVFTGLSGLSGETGVYTNHRVWEAYAPVPEADYGREDDNDEVAAAAGAAAAAAAEAAAESAAALPAKPAEPPAAAGAADHGVLDFSAIAIPRARLTAYLGNWVTRCAPQLDKFDEDAHFQTEVPLLARREPALLYALLAFSARQMERSSSSGTTAAAAAAHQHRYDSLELYQESIRHLAPRLQAKDPNTLVTACILAVFELMVGRSRDWRRHLEGCAALFAFFSVHGFSPGLGRAVFWCYARMELCGAIMSEGSEPTLLPLDKWVPGGQGADNNGNTDADDAAVRALFLAHSKDAPAVYACWSVYLCAKVCQLRVGLSGQAEPAAAAAASSPAGSSSGSSGGDPDRRTLLAARWLQLWRELALWYRERPAALVPVIDAEAVPGRRDEVFPLVFFSHYAAISSNQLYHTACILMLEMQREVPGLGPVAASDSDNTPSAVWHARRVCGISCSNAHNGSWVNAIQPLYVAGTFFTHLTERLRIARLLQTIDRATGWGALWRLKDLEAEWGFDEGELLDVL